jgi:hypothetical protein
MTPTTPKSKPYALLLCSAPSPGPDVGRLIWCFGTLQVTSGGTVYESATTFEDVNLTPELLKGLHEEMGFSRPSKIQAITLPMILTPPYKDLVAQAHNGSGKTTCFVLGMLSRIDPNRKVPQAICICPTRELAQQVCLLSRLVIGVDPAVWTTTVLLGPAISAL